MGFPMRGKLSANQWKCVSKYVKRSIQKRTIMEAVFLCLSIIGCFVQCYLTTPSPTVISVTRPVNVRPSGVLSSPMLGLCWYSLSQELSSSNSSQPQSHPFLSWVCHRSKTKKADCDKWQSTVTEGQWLWLVRFDNFVNNSIKWLAVFWVKSEAIS